VSMVWPWVGGIVIGLCIIGLLAYGRAGHQTCRIARGAIVRRS
jgi:hypothetical protein